MTGRAKNQSNAVIQLAAYDKLRKGRAGRSDTPSLKVSRHVAGVAKCHSLQPLGNYELASLHTLFAWVANEQDFAEETVVSITETEFGVSDIGKLKQKDYDEVVKFLVDLRVDEMCH